MKLRNCFFIFLAVIALASCKNDDDDDVITVELQTLSETAVENDLEIQEFLQTHFYNYEDFEAPTADFDYIILIDTIAGTNSEKEPLINQVRDTLISVSPDVFATDDEDNVSHKLYYLNIRNGIGANATIADSTYLNYQGSLLNGEVFDSRNGAPIWLDLQGNPLLGSGSAVTGFRQGLTKFKEGGAIAENFDGTFSVENPSIGLIIMPSGLGYFSSSTPGESYAPMIFTINMIRTLNADHDNDGIPSILEDLDNDIDLFNDDTDEDGLPNFVDTDDDGDEILTLDEISDDDGNIITPYPDSDGDGTPDYLDSDS